MHFQRPPRRHSRRSLKSPKPRTGGQPKNRRSWPQERANGGPRAVLYKPTPEIEGLGLLARTTSPRPSLIGLRLIIFSKWAGNRGGTKEATAVHAAPGRCFCIQPGTQVPRLNSRIFAGILGIAEKPQVPPAGSRPRRRCAAAPAVVEDRLPNHVKSIFNRS